MASALAGCTGFFLEAGGCCTAEDDDEPTKYAWLEDDDEVELDEAHCVDRPHGAHPKRHDRHTHKAHHAPKKAHGKRKSPKHRPADSAAAAPAPAPVVEEVALAGGAAAPAAPARHDEAAPAAPAHAAHKAPAHRKTHEARARHDESPTKWMHKMLDGQARVAYEHLKEVAGYEEHAYEHLKEVAAHEERALLEHQHRFRAKEPAVGVAWAHLCALVPLDDDAKEQRFAAALAALERKDFTMLEDDGSTMALWFASHKRAKAVDLILTHAPSKAFRVFQAKMRNHHGLSALDYALHLKLDGYHTMFAVFYRHKVHDDHRGHGGHHL